ncbi:RNA-binding domain-containing protein, partial [Neoconidiobolus thromboides FSU 785]
AIEGWTIFVTGFHYEAAEEDVLDKFSEFGNVKNLHLNLDRNSGYVKGYALIEYDTYEEAKSAVDGVDNQMYLNKNLKASFAFIK